MNGYRYLTLQQRREIEIMYTSPENPISNSATSKAKKGPEKRTKHSKTASFETVLCWCSSGDSNPGFLPRFARKNFYFNTYRLAAKAATGDLAFVSGVLDRQNSSKRDGLMTVSFSGAPAGIRTPDTLLKRQVLCLLSYWGRLGWDGGTRTHYIRVKV